MKKSLRAAVIVGSVLMGFGVTSKASEMDAKNDNASSSVAQGASQKIPLLNPAASSAKNPVKNLPLKANSKPISASLLIDTSATLAKQNINSAGEDYSYSGFYRFDLGVPLSERLTASLRAGYSQEYSYALPDNSLGDFADTRLGLTASMGEIRPLWTNLKLSVNSNLTLPTSKESQKAGLKSALGLGASLNLPLGKFSLTAAPGLTQFFHDLEVQNDGRLNIERSASLLLSLDYSLTNKITLNISAQPTHSWTYRGTPRDSYLIGYDMGYEISKHAAINIGIYNKASALKTNGLDYNYALFDESQFMGYLDVTLTL